MFYVFEPGQVPVAFRWDYDRFFYERWCREAGQALAREPGRTPDLRAADFCVAAVTLGCVSFAALDRAALAAELSRCLDAAAGRKLVVFDLTDPPRPIATGPDLIVCKSAFHETTYDPATCVAIPQFPRYRFTERFLPAAERSHLAGFKGNPRSQYGDLRARLLALDGHSRFVVKAGIVMPRDIRIEPDGSAWENERPGEPSHTRLLFDSTFALLPRACGYALSYRMVESMNAGCVPVIISDGYVLPFSERLDYGRFSIRVAESDVEHLPAILEARLPDADRLQAEACRVYEEYFSSTASIIHHTLSIAASR